MAIHIVENTYEIPENVTLELEGRKVIVNGEKGIVERDFNHSKISVEIKNVDFPQKENDLINVFGELDTKVDGEKIMIAKIIQDMNRLNFEYYLKLYELKKKYG